MSDSPRNPKTFISKGVHEHKLTLGVRVMLILAARDHAKRYRGKLPRAFVMHPECIAMLHRELAAHSFEAFELATRDMFHGIPVSADCTEHPYIIEYDGAYSWI